MATFASVERRDRRICDDRRFMPSPIGHALSGVAIAWTASLAEPPDNSGRTLSDRWLPIYMALAAAPDLDLLVHGAHRTATHSVTAMLLVTIVAAVVTGQVTRLRASRFGGQAPGRASRLGGQAPGRAWRFGGQAPGRASRGGGQAPVRASRFAALARWRVALLCGLSYGSHLLLDWLAADNYPPRGIQLLWPFSRRWFISDVDLFRQTARQEFFTAPIIRQNVVAVAQECLILLPILALIACARLRQRRQLRIRN